MRRKRTRRRRPTRRPGERSERSLSVWLKCAPNPPRVAACKQMLAVATEVHRTRDYSWVTRRPLLLDCMAGERRRMTTSCSTRAAGKGGTRAKLSKERSGSSDNNGRKRKRSEERQRESRRGGTWEVEGIKGEQGELNVL